jgi:MFS family permease
VTEPSRRTILTAVFSSSLGVGVIFGFQPPLIALTLVRTGSSSFAIGCVISIGLVAVILFGPVYPRVISWLGLRRCIVLGIGSAALILLLMPLRPGVPFWLLLQSMSGSALGLSWISSEIWMNNVSGAKSRGIVMGIYGTVISLGIISGPVLLEFTGTRGAWPFASGSLVLLISLLPLLVLRQVVSEPQAFAPWRSLRQGLGAAPIVWGAALVAGLVESADLTLLPLFGVREGLTERAALMLVTAFLAGNVVLQVPVGILADRYGRRRVLGMCALLSGVGPLLLRYGLGEPLFLWPMLFMWGGTLYAFYAQGVALMGEEFGAAQLPGTNTLFVMVYCLGGVIGPSVGGLAMDHWPHQGLQVLVSGAALTLFAGLLIGRRARRR